MRRLGCALGLLAASVSLVLLLHKSFGFANEASTLMQMPAPSSLRCLELRMAVPSGQLASHRRELLARVTEMPRRIREVEQEHVHDADGQWPADVLGDFQRTLAEAGCFAHSSEAAQVKAVTTQLEPLLAHAGLLGHSNRTAALASRRSSPRQSEQATAHTHHDELRDLHDVHRAHPAIGYTYA